MVTPAVGAATAIGHFDCAVLLFVLQLLQAILTILGQLPGLTHLLLLPSRQAEAAAAGTGPGMGGPAALQQQATGLHGNGRPREWQLNEAALW